MQRFLRTELWTIFMTIAENLTVETMVAITKYLLSMDAERLVSMLKGLFLSHGMYEAAGELDLLDICSEYEEDAVCFFEEAFYPVITAAGSHRFFILKDGR